MITQIANILMLAAQPSDNSAFPWCAFAVLYGVGLMGGIAILPYMTAFIRARTADAALMRKQLSLQFLQNALMLALSIVFGLKAALATGLAHSVTTCWRDGVPALMEILPVCVLAGVLAGAMVLLIDSRVLMPRLPGLKEALRPVTDLKSSYKVLAALYGGLAEELIMRLGLFSLLVWLIQSISHRSGESDAVLWTANTIVSVGFAAGHLPAMAALTRLTPLVATRIIVLNFPLSLFFGYAYFRFGLEAAVALHTVTSLTIQIGGTLINR